MGLRCVQLQLLKCLGDRIEAGGVERLDGDGNLRQLPIHHNDEVLVAEAHVRIQDLADAVTSHPWPDVDVKMRKNPLPSVPTIGISSCHQQVNF